MSGCFIVFGYPPESENPHDIGFQLEQGATKEIPAPQHELKMEVERTLDVLRAIYDHEHEGFKRYFKELLSLTQYGLVGKTAQPKQAKDTLNGLQARIYDREKGRVISAHMLSLLKALAGWLLGLMIVFAIVLGVTSGVFGKSTALDLMPAAAMIPGLFVGIVFSAFSRCKAVTFHDLRAIDADRFSPNMRAAFAVVVLILSAVLLKAELFEIVIGKIKLSEFDANWLSAAVFGIVVGVAQEAFVSRIESIRERASQKPSVA